MISFSFPFIHDAASLAPGKTYGLPDVIPEERKPLTDSTPINNEVIENEKLNTPLDENTNKETDTKLEIHKESLFSDTADTDSESDSSGHMNSEIQLENEKHYTQCKIDNEKLEASSMDEYINAHPEIKEILAELEDLILLNKPSNILAFLATKLNEKVNMPKSAGPTPIVFAGPSGVGKGTIVGILMKKYPNLFGFSVSHTTRAPRPGEENGVHYNFVAKDLMETAISNNEFIEYACVHTNYYGSSFKAVESVRDEGKICILDIDIQGVQNVKKSDLNCYYIFISPPSIEELESRLRGRGTETEDKIQIRMKNASDEIEYGNTPGNFDFLVSNNNLEQTVDSIIEKLKIWYPNFDFENK